MKKEDIKIGMKVKATKECYSAKRGEIYIVEPDQVRGFLITGDNHKSWCNCWETWVFPKDKINK
ncbi:MAG: hypothetical protein AABY22_21305 [Nanoarchaeota archaeon]